MTRRLLRLGLGFAAVMAVVGCGSSVSGPRTIASARTMTHPLIVPNPNGGKPDGYYEPNPIRVRVGQTITWTNKDTDPHDVTADNGAFDSGPIPGGGTWQWMPTRPGTYTYFCTIHPEMSGEIIVRS